MQVTSTKTLPVKRFAAVALAYFFIAEISINLSIDNVSTAIVWPAAGIAFAMVLNYGPGIWPAIAIGSLLANFHFLLGRDPSLLQLMGANAGIALGNVLAPVSGLRLMKLVPDARFDFSRLKDVFNFALLGVAPSAMIAALGGALSIHATGMGGGHSFSTDWLQWSVSDFVGTLMVAPIILLWMQNRKIELTKGKAVELGFVTLFITVTGLILFGPLNAYFSKAFVRPYLLLLPLIWGAMRFSPRAIATWNLSAFLIIWLGTSYGYGFYNNESLSEPLVTVQMFLGTVGFTVLLLSAALVELKRIRASLMKANINLEKRVSERTRELVETATALKAEKDRAEKATRLKDKFVSLVSHDLRSPLASLVALLSIIKETADDGVTKKRRGEMADSAINTAHGLMGMIDKLLDISRLQSGQMELHKIFFQAHVLAENYAANLMHLAEAKGVEVKNELPSDMRIFGDPDLLGEVMQNLISNAIKFSDKGGIVTISLLNLSDRRYSIAVRDNGVGIVEELIPNLFRQEVKTSVVGTAGEKGLGLGLPYSYEIMKAHGGDLRVEPKGDGGSAFIMELPDVRTIIVVADDLEAQRIVISEMLGKAFKAEIMEVENGKEVMGILKNVNPNLIITDIEMPEMDGIELLKTLKADSKTKTIPVFVITGGRKNDLREKALELGAADFANKPLIREDFVSRVGRLLA